MHRNHGWFGFILKNQLLLFKLILIGPIKLIIYYRATLTRIYCNHLFILSLYYVIIFFVPVINKEPFLIESRPFPLQFRRRPWHLKKKTNWEQRNVSELISTEILGLPGDLESVCFVRASERASDE